jgi:putative PIN family toxin of toxin-antitoxin system
MRIVADTTTVVSGLLWRGAPRQLIDAARQQIIELCTGPVLLSELAAVIGRAKFARRLREAGVSAEALIQDYVRLAEIVPVPALAHPVCRDPDDDHVLACAVASSAEAIVSGDDDLLSLGQYRNIPILTVAQILERIPR